MKASKIIEEYDVIGSSASQKATIYFKNGEFDKVIYKVYSSIYSRSDWRFLHLIAETITQIEKEAK